MFTFIFTTSDAQKKFTKDKMQVFAYFKALDPLDEDYKYYKFNPQYSFEKNLLLLKKKFLKFDGYFKFYTNKENYPLEQIAPQINHFQQSFNF